MEQIQDAKSEATLEENFALLQEQIKALESDSASLEESFKAYSRGMELVRLCSEQIDMVEKKVLVLSEDGTLEEFQ